MVRFLATTFALLSFVMLQAGCAKQEDLLVQKKIKLFEEMASLYEDVKDKAGFDEAREKMKPIWDELAKIEKEINDHPGKEKALAKHKEKFDDAEKRFREAKQSAASKGLGQ